MLLLIGVHLQALLTVCFRVGADNLVRMNSKASDSAVCFFSFFLMNRCTELRGLAQEGEVRDEMKRALVCWLLCTTEFFLSLLIGRIF
jgi:hypothetical protein